VLSAMGDIFCFGSNKLGQIGQPAFHIKVCALYPTRVPVPTAPHTPPSLRGHADKPTDDDGDAVMSPAASPDHATAKHPESPPEGSFRRTVAQAASPPDPLFYVDIACGDLHTVALRSDGAIVCWGQGEHGQVGSQSTANAYGPVLARPPPDRFASRFVAVSAGYRHSAAVAEDGTAFLWGDGSLGQIGDGEMSGKLRPIPIRPLRVLATATETQVGGAADDAFSATNLARADAGPSRAHSNETSKPYAFVQVRCGAYHNLAFVSQTEAPRSARDAYKSRVPLIVVDQMVSARAGLPRFGSAAALYRSFVEPVPLSLSTAPNSAVCVRAERVVKAYSTYLGVFGAEGKGFLARAASKLRHEAQAAFGMRTPSTEQAVFTNGYWEMEKRSLVTPSDELAPEDAFRCDVADMRDAGVVLFLAILNPTYQDKERLKELGELATLIVRLRRDAREAFVVCAQFAVPELLAKCIIRPLQYMISEELRSRHRVTKHATNATKVIGLCHRANEERKRMPISAEVDPVFEDDKTERGLPAEEFYNDSVSVMIDVQEDWLRWNKARADSVSRIGDSGSCADDLDATGRPRDPPFSFCEHSFILNKLAKYKILAIEAHNVMENEMYRSWLSFGSIAMPRNPAHVANMGLLVLHVRRSSIVADTFAQLSDILSIAQRDLHKTLKVVFVGEEGLDEGGVRKEFFQVLMGQLMSPDYGMFEYHEEARFHWFRRDSLEDPTAFMLVGIAVGLALFNSTLLDVQFPPVAYRKLQAAVQYARQNRDLKDANFGEGHYVATLGDVAEVYPSIANSLRHLLHYEGSDVEEVFGLTYEVPYEGLFGKASSAELIPGGASVAVTVQNREDFTRRYISYLINDSIETVFQQFAKGLLFMLSGPFVGKLTAEELQTLVIGEKELDFEALRATCRYEGYTAESPVVQNLWTVLFELDQPMRQRFLSFVTGSDRAPIGGLGNLGLIVQNAGGDTDRLPTSHTCFNVLLLPEYVTRAKLRSLLLLAIQNSEGFYLR
jgi:ubiquitin-protein ligase E3 A